MTNDHFGWPTCTDITRPKNRFSLSCGTLHVSWCMESGEALPIPLTAWSPSEVMFPAVLFGTQNIYNRTYKPVGSVLSSNITIARREVKNINTWEIHRKYANPDFKYYLIAFINLIRFVPWSLITIVSRICQRPFIFGIHWFSIIDRRYWRITYDYRNGLGVYTTFQWTVLTDIYHESSMSQVTRCMPRVPILHGSLPPMPYVKGRNQGSLRPAIPPFNICDVIL